jgi:hypothetical protein
LLLRTSAGTTKHAQLRAIAQLQSVLLLLLLLLTFTCLGPALAGPSSCLYLLLLLLPPAKVQQIVLLDKVPVLPHSKRPSLPPLLLPLVLLLT